MNNLSISSHYGRIKKELSLHFRYQDGVLVSGRRSIITVMNGVGNWYSRHCPALTFEVLGSQDCRGRGFLEERPR